MGRVKLTNEMARAISEKIDEMVQREREITLEEVIRELGGTIGPSLVMRAVDRYPPRWAMWIEHSQTFVRRKTPRETEAWTRKVREEEIKIELRSDEEIKKVMKEEKEERGKSLVERIEEILAREGGGTVLEVAEKLNETPAKVVEAWRREGNNPFIALKEDRFVVDTYSAMVIVNRVCDIVRREKFVPVRKLSEIMHIPEDRIFQAWNLCKHMIKDVGIEGYIAKTLLPPDSYYQGEKAKEEGDEEDEESHEGSD